MNQMDKPIEHSALVCQEKYHVLAFIESSLAGNRIDEEIADMYRKEIEIILNAPAIMTDEWRIDKLGWLIADITHLFLKHKEWQ